MAAVVVVQVVEVPVVATVVPVRVAWFAAEASVVEVVSTVGDESAVVEVNEEWPRSSVLGGGVGECVL
jgi:hypothetical protein